MAGGIETCDNVVNYYLHERWNDEIIQRKSQFPCGNQDCSVHVPFSRPSAGNRPRLILSSEKIHLVPKIALVKSQGKFVGYFWNGSDCPLQVVDFSEFTLVILNHLFSPYWLCNFSSSMEETQQKHQVIWLICMFTILSLSPNNITVKGITLN